MKTILDIINEASGIFPKPVGEDVESKKFVGKYGGLLLELLEYLQKERVVYWTVGGNFKIESIHVEESTYDATVGDHYFIISLHTGKNADFRSAIASILIKLDEKTHKVWWIKHRPGNYREWNEYNFDFSGKGEESTIKFLRSKGMYELKYNLDGKHPELPIPTAR